MKVGLYPGSFNPWHAGHQDVLDKALQVFDKVIVVQTRNPKKDKSDPLVDLQINNVECYISVKTTLKAICEEFKATSVIRGLRNGNDLQYEMNQQYWNEDVGIVIPFVYFITDRSLAHVSSSTIRMVNELNLKHKY